MQAWESFLSDLEQKIGKKAVDQWLRPLHIIRFDACNLYLKAENTFQIAWFEEHIRKIATTSFKNNNAHPIKIHFLRNTGKEEKKKGETPSLNLTFSSSPFDATQTFSSFLYEEKNQMTVEFCKRLAPGSFNPLFLFGPPGCGKTHLLMACANKLHKSGLSVFFVHAETFTEHVVKAIRNSEMQNFRNIYRNQDVLIIDDVHYLAYRQATQEELFHTFNALHTQGKQIILSGLTTPSLIEGIEPRLTSRFEWGISLELHPLSKKKFARVLRNRAHLHHFPLTDLLISFLLDAFSSSTHAIMRSLEALMLRQKTQDPLSPEQAAHLLSDLLEEEKKQKLTEQKILTVTSTYFGIRREDILGKSQSRECVLPRKLAMYLCRKKLNLSYANIGKIFSRDHSTAMASISYIEKNSGAEEIHAALEEINRFLRAHH